jgi:hypothetical protein
VQKGLGRIEKRLGKRALWIVGMIPAIFLPKATKHNIMAAQMYALVGGLCLALQLK